MPTIRKPKTGSRLGFDLKVQHRDPKTGVITKETPYTLKCSKEGGQVFIRAGIRYHPDGTPHPGQEQKLQAAKAKEKPAKAKEPKEGDAA